MHPIVTQMQPSPEQAPAIIERGRDVVVTAGAGTGKTRTLVARYLSLLAEGVARGPSDAPPLRSILAITFTRKAAREMRNRVRKEVRRYLERADVGEDERLRWRDLYSQLDAARIGTIHSFCSELLRAHPAEADVDPRFEVVDEGQAAILSTQAVDEALGWAADEAGIVELFELLGERGLREALEWLLAQRLDVDQAFARLPVDLLGHWQRVLRTRQADRLEALVQRPEWTAAAALLRDSQASQPEDRMEQQRRDAVAALDAAADSLESRLEALSSLQAINLIGGRQKAWPRGKEHLQQIKAALRTLRELWEEQAGVLELSLTPQDEALADAMSAVRSLFDRAAATYAALKAERQALDYDDLEQQALDLLDDHPAVLQRWQTELQAILVDEFQDTNARQRDLVARLTEPGGKLFLVGDAKQSIYRFRGADVVVFREERQRVAQERGAVLALDTSYRAHEALIVGLNNLLRPVLGEETDPQRPWVEAFVPLEPFRPNPGPGFGKPHIELHLTVGSKSGGGLDRAAQVLTGRLVELMTSGVEVVEGKRFRPLDPGDVAILCRASTSFGAYEDALEKARVPFLTVAGRGFYGRPEIRDLLNALQALADPTDDLALAGLLRSPACGVSDGALYQLGGRPAGTARGASLWEIARTEKASTALSPQDQRRMAQAVALITRLHGQAGRTSVADLLKAFLEATDYRAALIHVGQARGARNVAKLLADAHASGLVGVGEFLEYVTGLRDVGAREGEARSTAEGAVQIMTVHAAKGLEFPVVVLGDITYGGSRHGSSPLLDPDLGVLLPVQDEEGQLPALYQLARSRSDDQEQTESDRLLYVAATRAREKLLLSGCIRLRQDNSIVKLGGWLERLAGPECLGLAEMRLPYEEDGAGILDVPLKVGSTPVRCSLYEPGYMPLFAPIVKEELPGQAVPIPPPRLAPVAPGRRHSDSRVADQDRDPPQRVWRIIPPVQSPRAPAWVIGSIVHAALAAWRFPIAGSPGTVDPAFSRWAQARARGYGLADARQLADAVRRSQQLLARFRNHPLYHAMDSAARRHHEVGYSRIVDGRVESGILDALYLREGGWTLVEFKTDRVQNQAEMERVLAETDYLAQAQRYLAAAEQLLDQRPQFILCFLNYGGRVHLHPLPSRTGA